MGADEVVGEHGKDLYHIYTLLKRLTPRVRASISPFRSRVMAAFSVVDEERKVNLFAV
jgi:hypothetical protein